MVMHPCFASLFSCERNALCEFLKDLSLLLFYLQRADVAYLCFRRTLHLIFGKKSVSFAVQCT